MAQLYQKAKDKVKLFLILVSSVRLKKCGKAKIMMVNATSVVGYLMSKSSEEHELSS